MNRVLGGYVNIKKPKEGGKPWGKQEQTRRKKKGFFAPPTSKKTGLAHPPKKRLKTGIGSQGKKVFCPVRKGGRLRPKIKPEKKKKRTGTVIPNAGGGKG